MTRIEIDISDLERARAEIQSALEDQLSIAEGLGRIWNGLPQMAPADLERISARLERAIGDIVRLCYRYAEAADALGVTIQIVRRDLERGWDPGSVLAALSVAYGMTAEVYDYAAKKGISVADAAEELGGGKALAGMATLLGPEGVASKIATKAAIAKWAGVAFVAIEQWNAAEGGNWERLNRTVSVTGISLGLGAVANKMCGRVPHLIGKGACYVVGGLLAGEGTNALAKTLYDREGLTKEELGRIKAAGTVSGLTPAEEERRADEAHAGWMAARRRLLRELIAEGMPRDEAEMIVDLNFPDYSSAGV